MAIQSVQAIINGVTTTLDYNSSTGNYEKQITAPAKSSYNINAGHYYPITVKATDTAGNSTNANDTDSVLGQSLRLNVKETVAPVSIITYPTESQIMANSSVTVEWKVTDNDSGVKPDTISITVDNGSSITGGIAKTVITSGYQCSYTISSALSDGSHTVKVNAKDFDQNSAVQRTVNFVIDTVPPELSVTSPVNNLITNQNSMTIVGKTSDITSGLKKVNLILNNTAPIELATDLNGNFSKNVQLQNGTNVIAVSAEDKAGKVSSIVRTVVLDTAAPVISQIVITPNPVSTGELITISVKVVD